MAQNLREAVVSFSASGDNDVIAALTGQSIKVHRLFLVVSATTNLTPKDGATAFTGAISMTANGSWVLDYTELPWFTTTAGNAFRINQSDGAQVSGRVYYQQGTP